MHSPAAGLRVLSLALGVFFLFMGLDKVGWLLDSGLLAAQLHGWIDQAPAPSRWYIETIAIPGAPVFGRLVLIGELAVAAALLSGRYVRVAAVAGLFMVVNFHFAMGVMLKWNYLWNAYGPPVLGGLAALAIGGATLPWSIPGRSRLTGPPGPGGDADAL
jgi:uncharacterized membrane protein YphA (DoxX/SURF4 family)